MLESKKIEELKALRLMARHIINHASDLLEDPSEVSAAAGGLIFALSRELSDQESIKNSPSLQS